MKLGDAKIDPYISVDVSAAQPLMSSSVLRLRAKDDYEDAIAGMRNEITDLIDALCALRAEAETFIEWRHGMGEGTGASSWGLHQQTYSAELHLQQRTRAAELKLACEHRSPGSSERWIDKVFVAPGRYGEAVTAQAREELGL